jgi:hypothetical protein
MLSVKLMSAMPVAAGHRIQTSSSCGRISEGRLPDTAPIVATPD